ncbi:FHA domain-containing protein [Aggregatilinea lenta]|uniref:FHA domain-containing protein n=1 Tax=Aggregatilinea lenta TaxID=913108 RepID=UPI000E5C2297|nr:FHA domain-containing protein [Aggregatilinea lenta]
MNVCPNCKQPNREGEVFCQACGMALAPVPLTTRSISEHREHCLDCLGASGVILLQPEGADEPVAIRIQREVLLGRTNEGETGVTPLDLSPYGAMEKGVSRHHARLMRDDRSIYLIDMRSTNGTLLNGEPLPASVEWRVRDGDEIVLGHLKLAIYFDPD